LPTHRGFILQPTYRVEAGRPVVHLYGVLEDGRPFLVRDRRPVPRFYVEQKDADRARSLGAVRQVATDRVTLTGAPVVAVEVATPSDTPPLRDRLHLSVIGVDASDRFLAQLKGVTDPEEKRKRIGREFIDVFAEQAEKLQTGEAHGEIGYLVQGTLYPDVIESVSVKGPSATIKTHHNVGGLPEKMPFALIEPLRDLFKDEVRRIGKDLGLPQEILVKHPFPGPGLAVRLLGEVTRANLLTLQEADAIVVEEIRRARLYEKVWQAFAVLLPVRSVGVMGDGLTYGLTVAVRVVESDDAMTADWARLPGEVLERMSTRIVNEVPGVTRVVYDISSKPPSTIEWE